MSDKQFYTIEISFASEKPNYIYPYPSHLINNIEQSRLFNPLKRTFATEIYTLSIVYIQFTQYEDPIWGSQGISYIECEQIIKKIKDLRPLWILELL